MSLVQIVTLLATVVTAGWFTAFIVQAIKRSQWKSSVKLVLAGVVAAVVGLATAWLSGDITHFVTVWKGGQLTAGEVITFATLIFTAAQVWYHKFFKDSTWAVKLGEWGGK